MEDVTVEENEKRGAYRIELQNRTSPCVGCPKDGGYCSNTRIGDTYFGACQVFVEWFRREWRKIKLGSGTIKCKTCKYYSTIGGDGFCWSDPSRIGDRIKRVDGTFTACSKYEGVLKNDK